MILFPFSVKPAGDVLTRQLTMLLMQHNLTFANLITGWEVITHVPPLLW